MSNQVAVVTVTYGNRAQYLRKVLHAIWGQTASSRIALIVICDNGSADTSKEVIRELALQDARVRVEDLGKNLGSAGGYARGIEVASAFDVDLIWCLDDDNAPEPDALGRLLEAYDALPRPAALLGLRESRAEYVRRASGAPMKQCFPRPYSFCGFSLAELPSKLARRGARRRDNGVIKPRHHPVTVPYAPYGGFMFPRQMLERVGVPRREYYLYGDDHEFSQRFIQSECPIYLVPGSIIRDLEISWNRGGNSTDSFLAGPLADRGRGAETRLYYATRNRVHLEAYSFRWKGHLSYWVNLSAYLVLLAMQALLIAARGDVTAWSRFKTFVIAAADGIRGRVGTVRLERHSM